MLALPWAFLQSGTVLSTLIMILSVLLCCVSCDYLLASIARAQYFFQWKQQQQQQQKKKRNEIAACAADMEAMSLLGIYNGDDSSASCIKESSSLDALVVQPGLLDLPDACTLFLGRIGNIGYCFCIVCVLFGYLWGYCSEFGRALAEALPIQNADSYRFWVLIFASLVVPISCLELKEQVCLQTSISMLAMLLSMVVIISPLFAEYTDSVQFGSQTHAIGAPLWDVTGLYKTFPIICFSLVFHHSVGTLSVDVKDKSQLDNIFFITLLIVGLIYLLIGLVGASYFGTYIDQSYNVNWGVYHGGTGHIVPTGDRFGIAPWAMAVSWGVVCSPALIVFSAFPLDAVVLGNTLRDFCIAPHDRNGNIDRKVTIFFRCLASVPPVGMSLYIRELGKISNITGLSCIAILCIFPPLLFMQSDRKLRDHGLMTTMTIYGRFGSSFVMARGVLLFGILSVGASLLLLILGK